MYYAQKGLLPTITGLISVILPIGSFLLFVVSFLGNANAQSDISGTEKEKIGILIFFFIVMLIPCYVSLFLASLFPNVEIGKTGLKIFYWGFLIKINIDWKEIDSVVRYSNGYIILKFEKRGFSLFNGTYFHVLQSRVMRSSLPILILHPKTENLDSVVNEILKNEPLQVILKK